LGETSSLNVLSAAAVWRCLLQSVVMGAAASGVTMGILRCITKGATQQTLEGVRISSQVLLVYLRQLGTL
jgi:hypothetical protein